MAPVPQAADNLAFLKSLGFPELAVHHSFNHFDFVRPSRRILVIGPMGSGKTEYSSRVWRDSVVALKKSAELSVKTTMAGADRRQVFFIRSLLDARRFPDYPEDALAYRGGFIRCGERIARIQDSFGLEAVIAANPDAGTWIIDEASFYDERLVYVIRHESETRGLIFIFPALILNFRREIFNSTARLLLENATDVFPLTAYCEHSDCIEDSFYTYRYYVVNGKECPALYFDPLIVVGGDTQTADPTRPNYCTRCDAHHYLPGKEYTYFTLKPLAEQASKGDMSALKREIALLHEDRGKSGLHALLERRYADAPDGEINMNALAVPCIAEKALIYLFAEVNLITEDQVRVIVDEIKLDKGYLEKTLADNRRPVAFT
ncbi:MAG: thymidine kinase [Spirochaetales bacterium]|nr:thymidine kinase [Spirochaetales bacterium]